MASYEELGVVAQHLTVALMRAHRDPGSRDVLVHETIDHLPPADHMQVTGMVISMLCDALDSIGNATPALREQLDANADRIASMLPPLPDWAHDGD